jgi:hypothetical protein
MMSSNVGMPAVIRALIISLGVNLLMVLLPIGAIGPRTHHVFASISDTLAAPPGILMKHVFAPREHSTKAFELAAAESLFFSLLFYASISWLGLKCMARINAHLRRADGGP